MSTISAVRALADACWAIWNYASPEPPEASARMILEHLERAGFTIVERNTPSG